MGIFTPYRDFFRVSLISLCLKTFRVSLEVSRYLTSVKLAAKSKQRKAEYSGPSNWLTKLTLDSLGSLGSTGSLLVLPWLVLSSPLTHSWLSLDSFLAHMDHLAHSLSILGSLMAHLAHMAQSADLADLAHSWLTLGSPLAHPCLTLLILGSPLTRRWLTWLTWLTLLILGSLGSHGSLG